MRKNDNKKRIKKERKLWSKALMFFKLIFALSIGKTIHGVEVHLTVFRLEDGGGGGGGGLVGRKEAPSLTLKNHDIFYIKANIHQRCDVFLNLSDCQRTISYDI